MKFGVRLPNSGPFASLEAITAMATTAEKLGYDAISPHDHVNWGWDDRYHFYAGSHEAADAHERPTHFYDAFETMSYLAAITQRVRLIPAAICLGWRPVMILGRQALTLHQFSKGRFVLCICVGNVRSDFEMTGTPWDERVPISVEKLKVLRTLIDQPGPVSFEGKYLKFKDAELSPRPESLRLWWAGSGTEIAAKRAARYCDGLMGGPPDSRQKVFQEAQLVGRGHVQFEFATLSTMYIAPTDEEAWRAASYTLDYSGEWMQRHRPQPRRHLPLLGSPETVAERIGEYEAEGTHLIMFRVLGLSLKEVLEQMETFAREVMPLLK